MASTTPVVSPEPPAEVARTTTRVPVEAPASESARRTTIAAETIATPQLDIETEQPSRGAGWWWMLGFLAIGLAGWYYWPAIAPQLTRIGLLPSTKSKPTPQRIIPVGVATAEKRDIPLYLNGLGTVTALKTVTIRSRVDGELTKIAFSEGQMVKEGQLLAEIDPRTYQVQKEQAEGQLARDEATLRAARLTLSRLKQLFDQKIATAQQVDDQLGLVQQFEGATKSDQAQIGQAELQLTYCRILAPISGRIGLRLVDQGNMVHANDAMGMAVITQLQPIALVFTLPQDDIARVQKRFNEEGTLPVEAYDRDLRHRLATGKLTALDNQVDPTNGTVRLKGEFENTDGMLFPNQFVNARLLLDTQRDAVVIPAVAVQRGPNGSFVYVVVQEQENGAEVEKVELRNVIVGATEEAVSAITSGVMPGDQVVTTGLDRLYPGAKVTTKSAARDGEGTGKEKTAGKAKAAEAAPK